MNKIKTTYFENEIRVLSELNDLDKLSESNLKRLKEYENILIFIKDHKKSGETSKEKLTEDIKSSLKILKESNKEICKEKGCNKDATKDYNGHEY